MKNIAGLFTAGLIVAFVLAAIRYSGAAGARATTEQAPARLVTVAHTARPTVTVARPPTDDPLVFARATIMAGDAAATREQGARIAAATSTAWAAGQERTATWSAVNVISAGLALSQTAVAAVQTEIVVRSQIMSATEEYFVSPLRVQATQTAIAADSMAEAQMGVAWSVLAWGVVLCLLSTIVLSAVGGLVTLRRYVDAWLRLHEADAWGREADVHLKLNPRPAAPAPAVHTERAPITSLEREQNAEMERKHIWTVNLQALGYAAAKYGWSIRALGPQGANIISHDGWERVTKFYKQPAVGVLLDAGRGTVIDPSWGDFGRWHDDLRRGTLPLPQGEPVNVVAVTSNTPAPQRPPTPISV